MTTDVLESGGRRRWWFGLLAVGVVLAGLLATSGVALAQRSVSFSLGCWAITSTGGANGNVQSASFRMQNSMTWIGGPSSNAGGPLQASANFRLRDHHFATRSLIPPAGLAPTPPPADAQQWLPIAFGRIIELQRLC